MTGWSSSGCRWSGRDHDPAYRAGAAGRLVHRSGGFRAWGEYDVTISDPGDAADERELEWYFEQHLRFPFLDQDREHGTVEQISSYGKTLFAQVFGNGAAHEYRLLRERAFDGCQLEVSGSAEFHGLHWEALRDPEMDCPLAIRLPVIRRVGNQPRKFELPDEKTTLNILVVTARPDGPADVGYRTISRPLLTALRRAKLAVTVDMVRPGTWEALRTHLDRTSTDRGSGWYQIVHFDLHGAFTGYQQLEQQRRAEKLVFQPAQLPPFEGSDPHRASIVVTNLGGLLAELGRHGEAVEILLFAAVSWRQVSEGWNDNDLRLLQRERQAMGIAAFDACVTAHVPEELAGELVAAINQIQKN